MKLSQALGMVETRGLAASIEVADAMLKDANVSLVNQAMVDAALVTILIEGDVSSVQAAVEVGSKVAQRTGALIAFNVIPHPDIGTNKLVATTKEKKQMEKQSASKEQNTEKEEDPKTE